MNFRRCAMDGEEDEEKRILLSIVSISFSGVHNDEISMIDREAVCRSAIIRTQNDV